MRSDAAMFDLTAARSLDAVLKQIADEPGRYTPMAGGTELMVAFNTGRLSASPMISIQHLPELRFVQMNADTIEIGAGTTFADIRRHEALRTALPLLERTASWTGSIANQNRATIGGNVCNGSPAADTPPALLVYAADVTLISAGERRTLPYQEFHLGYKRTALRPNELLFSFTLRRDWTGYRQFVRKVGTRNAQAISKAAVAAVARVEGECIAEIRLGAASLADRPLQLYATEDSLRGASVADERIDATVRDARAAVFREARPIDDIRSTARYRSHVAANLVEEFVRSLS